MPSGYEGFGQSITMFHDAFPDTQGTIGEMVAEGDTVAVLWTWSGTHQGEFMGIPGTGKRFDIAVIDIIEFRGGKGVAHWGVMDMVGMMEQLGVGSPPA